MDNDKKLERLLSNNSISADSINNALYQDLLETVLAQICEYAKESSDNESYIRKEFRTFSNEVATRRVVRQITGFTLEEYEVKWICTCILAFFNKKPRRAFPASFRKNLLDNMK